MREMAVGDRFYRCHIPLIDAWIGHGIAVLGDHERPVPVLRSANDNVFDDVQFGQCMFSTRFFVEELLCPWHRSGRARSRGRHRTLGGRASAP